MAVEICVSERVSLGVQEITHGTTKVSAMGATTKQEWMEENFGRLYNAMYDERDD